jgi:hypothetical protein
MSTRCAHLDQIELTELPETVAGCEDCLRAGGKWLHLRICLTCGHVGCCDARSSGHPIIRSLEPGEAWCWCYIDEVTFADRQTTGRTQIPPSPLLDPAAYR